jgi:hypothetical protein
VPFSITQLIAPQGFERWLGENNPIRGYCADGYEVRVPCYEISYITKAEQARYVTYIHFGEDDFDITYDRDKSAVTLTNNETKAQYDIDILFPEDRLIDRSYIELAISAGGESDISLLNRIRSFLTEKF